MSYSLHDPNTLRKNRFASPYICDYTDMKVPFMSLCKYGTEFEKSGEIPI